MSVQEQVTPLQGITIDMEGAATATSSNEARRVLKHRSMGDLPNVSELLSPNPKVAGPPAPSSSKRSSMQELHHRLQLSKRLRAKLPSIFTPSGDRGDPDYVLKLRRRVAIRDEVVAAIAELVGTFMFLLPSLCIATFAGRQPKNVDGTLSVSTLSYLALGFGFALAVNAWVFFRVSGGLFNPAVTVGLFLVRSITWYRALILTAIQFIAAIAAAGTAKAINPDGMNARTRLSTGTSVKAGFFMELFCTAMLMFAIQMLANEKHKSTPFAPIGIGLALMLAELWAIPYTGGSLNPARTLGPDVVTGTMESYEWIVYFMAPYAGVMLSSGLYKILKLMRYEAADQAKENDEEVMLLCNDAGAVVGHIRKVHQSEAVDYVGPSDHHRLAESEKQ
ncbi:hypothetical protein CF326_g2741 [Tilletia indica]|nr:hypothetical protein CF326_g2741 [Tilletia indica]